MNGRWSFGPGVVALVSLVLAAPASAGLFYPNRFGDHPPNGCSVRDCTLREAVLDANSGRFAADIILQEGQTYNLRRPGGGPERGDLDIRTTTSIQSSRGGRATIDAHGVDRVFQVPQSSAATLTLRRLRIEGGYAGEGGAIRIGNGGLRLANSVLRNNVSANPGGFSAVGTIFDKADLTIARSTIANNVGSGVVTWGGPDPQTIRSSTISGNRGSGVFAQGANLAIIDSTITGNHTANQGGGVDAYWSDLSLNGDTIAYNKAGSHHCKCKGGGIAWLGPNGSFVVENSLIANNRTDTGRYRDCWSTKRRFNSGGGNLLGSLGRSGCPGFTATGDVVEPNPKLGMLADNGGPAKTIALHKRSPAIDAARPTAPARDERGVERDSQPDIGAFERRF